MSLELFPAFLKLAGRRVLLVGGGRVAAAKLPALLGAGAAVTVVAPAVAPSITASSVVVLRRGFEASDLDDAWLVVAAATPEVNRQVAQAAEARRVFANAVDDPENASAYTAGVFRRGGVTFAISTGGEAPALAGLLRQGLDAVVPAELDRWVEEARCLRDRQRAQQVPIEARRPQLLEALNRLYDAEQVSQPR
jgi:siroheme synthase-like protein